MTDRGEIATIWAAINDNLRRLKEQAKELAELRRLVTRFTARKGKP